VQATAAPDATESLQIMAAAPASYRYKTAFAYILIWFDDATQLAMLFCRSVSVSMQA